MYVRVIQRWCYLCKLKILSSSYGSSRAATNAFQELNIVEFADPLLKMFKVGNTAKYRRPPQQRLKFVILSKWEKCKLLKRQKELSYNFISSSWFQWCMEWRTYKLWTLMEFRNLKRISFLNINFCWNKASL